MNLSDHPRPRTFFSRIAIEEAAVILISIPFINVFFSLGAVEFTPCCRGSVSPLTVMARVQVPRAEEIL